MDVRGSRPAGAGGRLYSPMLEAAMRLAARGHYHQFRKPPVNAPTCGATEDPLPRRCVPYITHLAGTACILARLGARDEVIAAALLHDYLEDVPDPEGEQTIRRAVGDEVLGLVLAVTENKRPEQADTETWEVRKAEQIAEIETMPLDAVMIKTADLLHNLLSLIADLDCAEKSERVWERLNASPDRQLWYFRSVLRAASRRLGGHLLVDEFEAAIARAVASAD